jgi:hypothetical protein
MKRNIHIMKELCCSLVLLGGAVVTVNGAVDLDFLKRTGLDFLGKPDIPEEVVNFSIAIGNSFNLPGRVLSERVGEWMLDPTHRNLGEHPIRKVVGWHFDRRWDACIMEAARKVVDNIPHVTHAVSVARIDEAFQAFPRGNGGTSNVHVVLGLPVESLQHFTKENGAIVQAASQFNALESAQFGLITPLGDWVRIQAQGAGVSLQALGAAALRCAAQERGRLCDSIWPLLSECNVGGLSIVEKYPNLYRNGYLCLLEIRDLRDLEAFADYVEKNARYLLRMQMQWVRCEESGTTQLQVFCAAPSCQGVDWRRPDHFTECYKRISIALLRVQYRALAQMARISGRPLHLTSVGIGIFNNPTKALNEALKAVLEISEGTEIQVFLHGYSIQDVKKWNDALKCNGYRPFIFSSLGKDFFPPIALTSKSSTDN